MVALLYYINVNVKVKQWYRYILILNKKLKSLKCIQWIYVYITCLGIKQLCKTNIAILRYIMEIPTIDPQQ